MASPYFGGSLDSLQAARTAAETNATRIAIQKLIEETSRLNAQREAAQRSQGYDLQRQQLAQQGQYQQGMLGNQSRAIDSEALTRQAQALFDQERFRGNKGYNNALLEIERNKLAASIFAPRGPEAAAEVRAKAVADEFAQEQNLRSLAEHNLAELEGQRAGYAQQASGLDTLSGDYAAKLGSMWPRPGNWWPARGSVRKAEAESLFNQLPYNYPADPSLSVPKNIELARALFTEKAAGLDEPIKAIRAEGIGAFVRPLPGGMFTNTLPKTITSTNAFPVARQSITPEQRQQIEVFADRARKLGVPEAQINARIQQLLGQ